MMEFTRRQRICLFSAILSAARANTLAVEGRQVASETDGRLGAAALHLGTGQHVSLHGDEHFPLASVSLPAR